MRNFARGNIAGVTPARDDDASIAITTNNNSNALCLQGCGTHLGMLISLIENYF